jgi:hypothetical protein
VAQKHDWKEPEKVSEGQIKLECKRCGTTMTMPPHQDPKTFADAVAPECPRE